MQNEKKITYTLDKMNIVVAENRKMLGELSARDVGNTISQLLEKKEEIRMIFAAGPSQTELLNELASDKSIEWSRIVAFHMDEYIGLPSDSNELFGKFLADLLFSKVQCKKVHLLRPIQNGQDPAAECARYEALLKEKPIDIVCLGIGENGHIAFNDPAVADFNDPVYVKVVTMDDKCKAQQVNDGCFPSVDAVPPTAISLTIPALLSAVYLNVAVPGIRKSVAVQETLFGDIATKCPASILRTHAQVHLYLDNDSVSLARPHLGKFVSIP